MITEKGKFEVVVYDPNTKKHIKFFQSIEKKFYLCCEPNQPFQIRMISKIKERVYGAQLYIDGKEAHKNKTFKEVGHFFGFKLGLGDYNQFIFDVPPVKNSKVVEGEEPQRKIGSIHIDFFETESVKEENRHYEISEKREETNFIQEAGYEDKKFYLRSLSVRQGAKFKIDKQRPKSFGKFKINNYLIPDKLIDSIVIYYADFVALQIMGLISIRNIEHLLIIPDGKWDQQLAILALESILGSKTYKEGVNVVEVESIFQALTKKNLRDFFKGDLYNFLQSKPHIFKVTEQGIVSLSDRKAFVKRFCEIPSCFDKAKYINQKVKKEDDQFEALKHKRKREEAEVISLD